MTLPVFPQLAGRGWPLTRSPQWSTGVQTTQSGRELRASYMSYPRYKWSASYDVLRTAASLTEFQQLLGFFNLCAGMATLFVFNDPDDNTAASQPFGEGDGSTKQFAMTKAYGGFAEPAGFINSDAKVYVGGTLQTTGYTLNSPYNGWITFTAAPAQNAELSWSGTYGYVCRFLADTYDFDGIYSGIYSTKKIEFLSCKP